MEGNHGVTRIPDSRFQTARHRLGPLIKSPRLEKRVPSCFCSCPSPSSASSFGLSSRSRAGASGLIPGHRGKRPGTVFGPLSMDHCDKSPGTRSTTEWHRLHRSRCPSFLENWDFRRVAQWRASVSRRYAQPTGAATSGPALDSGLVRPSYQRCIRTDARLGAVLGRRFIELGESGGSLLDETGDAFEQGA